VTSELVQKMSLTLPLSANGEVPSQTGKSLICFYNVTLIFRIVFLWVLHCGSKKVDQCWFSNNSSKYGPVSV